MNWGDNMRKVNVGKVVNTHGIKGEIRILSDFQFKDKVFKVNNSLIIGDKEYIIKSYRVHKMFDMVTLEGYDNINDVLFLLKKDVYVDEDKLMLNDDEILDDDLLTYKAINNKGEVGEVIEVFYASATNKLLRVDFGKKYIVPYRDPFVVSIDKNKKEIVIELLEGME